MRILCTVGTRPEAVKMAPVIKALRRAPGIDMRVVGTGQHRELLDDTFRDFGITTDTDLRVMQDNQTLPGLTGRLFPALAEIVAAEKPDLVLAQGDTTTVLVASIVAFYARIPFGHVEAGLRTGDLSNPFPEEFNRVVAGRTAMLHFAPTQRARDNLLREGIPNTRIYVTGNTVIDALLETAARVEAHPRRNARRKILLTAHRRENFGRPIEEIFGAIRDLARMFPDLDIVYPVHPNPNVSEPAQRVLGSLPQVRLTKPLGYHALVAEMKACDLVLTDSGGIQEEAPALGKPVLVLRNATERPEAVEAGVARPIGTASHRIVSEVQRLLNDDRAYAEMARGVSPYGDGHAAERIVAAIIAHPEFSRLQTGRNLARARKQARHSPRPLDGEHPPQGAPRATTAG